MIPDENAGHKMNQERINIQKILFKLQQFSKISSNNLKYNYVKDMKKPFNKKET